MSTKVFFVQASIILACLCVAVFATSGWRKDYESLIAQPSMKKLSIDETLDLLRHLESSIPVEDIEEKNNVVELLGIATIDGDCDANKLRHLEELSVRYGKHPSVGQMVDYYRHEQFAACSLVLEKKIRKLLESVDKTRLYDIELLYAILSKDQVESSSRDYRRIKSPDLSRFPLVVAENLPKVVVRYLEKKNLLGESGKRPEGRSNFNTVLGDSVSTLCKGLEGELKPLVDIDEELGFALGEFDRLSLHLKQLNALKDSCKLIMANQNFGNEAYKAYEMLQFREKRAPRGKITTMIQDIIYS